MIKLVKGLEIAGIWTIAALSITACFSIKNADPLKALIISAMAIATVISTVIVVKA